MVKIRGLIAGLSGLFSARTTKEGIRHALLESGTTVLARNRCIGLGREVWFKRGKRR